MFATLRRLSIPTPLRKPVPRLPSTVLERPLPQGSDYPSIASLKGTVIPYTTPTAISHFVRNVWYLLYRSAKSNIHVRPDGFVRVKDVTGRFPFRTTNHDEFVRWAHRAHESIELVQQPDTYASTSKDLIWWFRRKQREVADGVDQATYRLLPGTAVRNAIFKATLPEWTYIRRNGLRPRPGTNIITMEAIDKIEETMEVVNTSHVYIFIDMEQAMKGGIDFYFTRYLRVMSPGNRDSTIPPRYFKDAIEVTVEKEVLHHSKEKYQVVGQPQEEAGFSEELIEDFVGRGPPPKPSSTPRPRKPVTRWKAATLSSTAS